MREPQPERSRVLNVHVSKLFLSFHQRMRETAAVSEKLDDFVTTDMLAKRLAFHEKAIWMLRAIIAA